VVGDRPGGEIDGQCVASLRIARGVGTFQDRQADVDRVAVKEYAQTIPR